MGFFCLPKARGNNSEKFKKKKLFSWLKSSWEV